MITINKDIIDYMESSIGYGGKVRVSYDLDLEAVIFICEWHLNGEKYTFRAAYTNQTIISLISADFIFDEFINGCLKEIEKFKESSPKV